MATRGARTSRSVRGAYVGAAVCFTLSGAEAAKKKHAAPKKPADAAYEWNLKNIPPPPPQAGAAGPAKKAAVHKKAKNAKKA